MEMFLPNSPFNPLSLSFSLGSPHVKVCGTPYTYIEKASPAPVVALAVKWLTGAIMSPRLCANFVLVLVRATISASPQCEAYILAAHTTQSGHTTHTHTLAPPRLPRTYQRAFYALTKRILISAWSLQSRRGTVEYIYIYIFSIHGKSNKLYSSIWSLYLNYFVGKSKLKLHFFQIISRTNSKLARTTNKEQVRLYE